MSIEVRQVVRRFTAETAALNDVTFRVEEGELIGFLGPSGSGKTTLLRLIAGLDQPTSGEIRIRGQVVNQVPPQRRGVGVVFQNYALFRHMTVFDNIAFGLRVQKRDKAFIRERVHTLLELVRLSGLESRYPHQLSGGQAQRVALARALAPEPSVLLLDEPFAAIDTKIRRELRKWVRKIHDEIGITSIFVTHDQEEALEIADRVLVMNQGRLEQLGTPEEVYHQPKSLFVANFVGEANHGQGTVERGKLVVGPLMFSVDQADGAKLSVVFRPSDVQLSPVGGERGNSVNAEGEIIHLTYKGTYYTADVRLQGGMQIQASLSPDQTAALGVGSRVGIHVKRVLMFDSEGRALPTENAVAVGAV